MERTDTRRERLLGRLVFCALVWVVLHAVTAVRNFITMFDCGFSGFSSLSAALGLVYLLCLPVVDMMTCIAGSRTAAGVLMKFWAVCGLLTAASLLNPLADLLALPILLLTPRLPLAWLLEWVSGSAFTGIVFSLCLIQFACMALLFYLGRKKGAPSHGSVDRGAGTVE